MENEIKKHIEKLREDKNPIYQQDGIDMENILLNLESKNYEIAESIYSKMDTIVRDDFVEKMTNEYKDKEKMKYLADKLGFEWIGDQKKFLEKEIKELGKCPHCKEEITELTAFSEISQCMQLMDNGEPNYSSHDYCEGFTEFDCPECNEKICTTEAEAIKFLKGYN